MGGYDERELEVTKRPLGRVQITRLPQGATNSVTVYQAQMTCILQEEIPKSLGIFIDYEEIKGPRSLYNQDELRKNFIQIEGTGLIISGSRLALCVPALDMVGHSLSFKGRKISKQNINKIHNWTTPLNKKEIKVFF
ncbi:hypothetical protein O181_000781 [Austropuccinia psidii MF-1]|uniref:Uncharacterized protein n=1 Tax=Austropuccinia psidii MF-1 TaxID=1389203 RepID=A0A9Q3GBV3_9BASI|nr:hypothetical protein [Austropuccinia psidii MF-1]